MQADTSRHDDDEEKENDDDDDDADVRDGSSEAGTGG